LLFFCFVWFYCCFVLCGFTVVLLCAIFTAHLFGFVFTVVLFEMILLLSCILRIVFNILFQHVIKWSKI
jgi:hypothetical protein